MSKVITLLGSTGSIGTQSLDVCRMHGYEVFGLSANSSVDKLLAQIAEFHPKYVAVTDPAAFDKLSAALAGQADAPKLLKGAEGLRALACMDGAGTVLNAVVGIAGLDASLAAIESGHDLALANKESLVTGGHLVTDAVKKHGVHLLPVDSEHSAIFQCLQDQHSAKTLEKILLTASGGPFFGMTTEQLRTKTKADALKHPNWNMGAKITIDSATLMNKGLELIEAAWLFGLPEDKIQIVVQRESIIHSAVQFADHSIIAQLGVPDMRIPIQYALTWPERLPSPVPELDFTALTKLSIATADDETFRCLKACKRLFARAVWLPAPPTVRTRPPLRTSCATRSASWTLAAWSRASSTVILSAATTRLPTSTSVTAWREPMWRRISDWNCPVGAAHVRPSAFRQTPACHTRAGRACPAPTALRPILYL